MSPVVFRLDGVKFHFFANEGNPREPMHIHATRPGCRAKFWLHPEVSLAYATGYNRRELTALEAAITARRSEIEKAWNAFFRDGR